MVQDETMLPTHEIDMGLIDKQWIKPGGASFRVCRANHLGKSMHTHNQTTTCAVRCEKEGASAFTHSPSCSACLQVNLHAATQARYFNTAFDASN